MDKPILRKPRFFFDVTARPSHVTFDDGRSDRQNFPWMHYVGARWSYADPNAIRVLIGDFLVLITGHNLAPLFCAIEEHTLIRVRARPDLAHDREHDPDSFATEIVFMPAPPVQPKKGQTEFDLGYC